MTDQSETFPTAETLPRAVLVRNISPLATSATLEDFFSFCGTIESHRLRPVQFAPNNSLIDAPAASSSQQAVVIFSDERARENALVMDKSSIVDTIVTITEVPPAFDFYAQVSAHARAPAASASAPSGGESFGFLGSGIAAFGDLFAGVGSAVAVEVGKAGKAIESSADTGVLKSAKDQMALATKRTKDFATDLDTKWHVRENVINAAEVGKAQASAVATVVRDQTTQIATQVDRSLHISENTEKIAEKARGNDTVNNGIRAFTGGFQNLLSQTGLQGNAAAGSAPTTTSDGLDRAAEPSPGNGLDATHGQVDDATDSNPQTHPPSHTQ